MNWIFGGFRSIYFQIESLSKWITYPVEVLYQWRLRRWNDKLLWTWISQSKPTKAFISYRTHHWIETMLWVRGSYLLSCKYRGKVCLDLDVDWIMIRWVLKLNLSIDKCFSFAQTSSGSHSLRHSSSKVNKFFWIVFITPFFSSSLVSYLLIASSIV